MKKTFYTFEIKYTDNNTSDFKTSVRADDFSEAITKAYIKGTIKAGGEFSVTYKKCYLA
jgi:hypothetical protein